MITTAPVSENQTFTITEEIAVRASLEQTFASLVAQMGRLNETPEGTPMPMILETRPAAVVCDLGGGTGTVGFVQSIKRPRAAEPGDALRSTPQPRLLYRRTAKHGR